MKGQAAVFLDRDGILNELAPEPGSGLYEAPLSLDQVRLIPGAAEAVRRLLDHGYLLAIVTNQASAAKGLVDLESLAAIHARVLSLLSAQNVYIDTSRLCLHHPDGIVEELSGPCSCRKPEPGMLLDAAQELEVDLASSWIIGDSDTDVEAGRRAGVRTILVREPGSAHKRRGHPGPDLETDSLAEAVERLLESDAAKFGQRD